VTAQPTQVEVFGVGADGALLPLTSCGGGPDPDGDRAWDHVSDHISAYRARPGLRPGGFEDRPKRHGGREDVVAPVHVLPGPASNALHGGEIFREPLPKLNIDVGSLEVDSRGSSWKATVACGRLWTRQRKATLRAYPSPSANLTVLELIPTSPRQLYTRAFVKAGVPAIATLGHRLTRATRRPMLPQTP